MYKKLNKIQTELKVAKTKRNNFGNFDYRSCEDILEALKPLLKQEELVLLLNDDIITVGERVYVKSKATLTDGENKIETVAMARESLAPKAKMDESQTTGSASSYARKYALNGLFCIDEGKDSDYNEDFSEIETIETIEDLRKYWTDNQSKVKDKKTFDAMINARKEVLSGTKK